MAPVEPAASARSNYFPVALYSSHTLVVVALTTNILRIILRASRTLPPTSSTRIQEPLRRRHVALFSFLSLLSLASVAAFSVAWRVISYQDWANEKKHDIPGSLWSGWYGNAEESVGLTANPTLWKLGDWMADTDLVREANEVGILSPEGFWWMGQRFAGLVGASMFMGVEGKIYILLFLKNIEEVAVRIRYKELGFRKQASWGSAKKCIGAQRRYTKRDSAPRKGDLGNERTLQNRS